MSTLRLYQRFEATIGGVQLAGGSRAAPQEIELGDQHAEYRKSLDAAEKWTPWTAASTEAVETLGFLWAETDLDGVQLELTADVDGSVGKRVFVIELKANKPFVLAGKGAMANYTEDFAAGTLDAIERVRFRNPAGASGAANVRLVVINEAS